MELPGVNDDLASSIILKGVSVARRTVENPLSFVSERFDITIPRCHAEPSGEVFHGEEDHLTAAVEALGSLRLWQLAIKPGRTVAIGELAGAGRTRPVSFIGLPGNPVAAITAFFCLARPILLRLTGAGDLTAPRYRLSAGFAHRKKPGRREFFLYLVQSERPELPGELDRWIAEAVDA